MQVLRRDTFHLVTVFNLFFFIDTMESSFLLHTCEIFQLRERDGREQLPFYKENIYMNNLCRETALKQYKREREEEPWYIRHT